MLARRAPQAGRRSERSPERRKSAWLSASRQCRAAQKAGRAGRLCRRGGGLDVRGPRGVAGNGGGVLV